MTALVATYSGAAQEAERESVWLRLWQPGFSAETRNAGTADLVQMWQLVLAGFSAKKYIAAACPAWIDADGVVHVPLNFYVFPSSLGLNYSLEPGHGDISEGVQTTLRREFDIVFNQTDTAQLDYLVSQASFEFLTPAYNRYGEQISRPEIEIDGITARLSHPCFCVVRAVCHVECWQHTITMHLQKYEHDASDDPNWTGYSITNLENAILASWMDAAGKMQTTELSLKVPKCAADYLSLCESGEPEVNIGDRGGKWHMVYYSICTGNILGSRTVDLGDR